MILQNHGNVHRALVNQMKIYTKLTQQKLNRTQGAEENSGENFCAGLRIVGGQEYIIQTSLSLPYSILLYKC